MAKLIFKNPFGEGVLKLLYALDAIHLANAPKRVREERFAQDHVQVLEAIGNVLDIDASDVGVKILRGIISSDPKLVPLLRERRFDNPFLQAKGKNTGSAQGPEDRKRILDHVAQWGPGRTQEGFYDTSKKSIVLDTQIGAYNLIARTHETLHHPSRVFMKEAKARWGKAGKGIGEGLVDFYTEKVIRDWFGYRRGPADYYPQTRVARALAELIGEELLKKIFFGDDAGLLERLKEEVDTRGGPYTFRRMMRALQDEKWVQAARILRGTAKPPTADQLKTYELVESVTKSFLRKRHR